MFTVDQLNEMSARFESQRQRNAQAMRAIMIRPTPRRARDARGRFVARSI